MTSHRPERRFLRLLRGARWTLIGIVAAMLLAPRLLGVTGHALIVVDGGSMDPTYRPGDVLLTSRPSGDDLQPGRILVVGVPPGLYTHRVVEARRDEAGVLRARLRGDANATADPGWITQAEVYAIPGPRLSGVAARLATAVMSVPGTILLVLLAVVLLCWSPHRPRTP